MIKKKEQNKHLKKIIENLAVEHERKVNKKMTKIWKTSRICNYTLRYDKAHSWQRNGKEQTKLLKILPCERFWWKNGYRNGKVHKENIKILTELCRDEALRKVEQLLSKHIAESIWFVAGRLYTIKFIMLSWVIF